MAYFLAQKYYFVGSTYSGLPQRRCNIDALIPFITTTLTVPANRLAEITAGLASGMYTRIGGVIQETASGRIVLWLRPGPVLDGWIRLAAVSNVVSLTLSAVNMDYVRRKMNVIEQSLQRVSVQLARIERKLNVEYMAQLRSALIHAQMALAMNSEQNRRGACIQAIESLMNVEQLFLGLHEVALEDEMLAVPALLQGAAFSYVAAARCMVDLKETESACRHLEEGGKITTDAANSLFAKAIMPRRALFLRPELAEVVSLSRLAELSTMAGQPVTASALYDELRVEIWSRGNRDFAQQARNDFDLYEGNATSTSNLPSFLQSPASRKEQRIKQRQQVVERVADVFDDVESVVEASSRLRGLALEMHYLREHNIGFDEWTRLSMEGEAMGNVGLSAGDAA